MPVDQLAPRRAPRSNDEHKLVKYDQYIDTQIKNTRRAVKLVDLATSLVLLAAGVLAFLLVAAVIEHWLVPGGFPVAVRTILFLLLVAGVAHMAYHRIWPLVRRAINPVYAAQTIERSSPSLKNSLVNLLLFRQHRGEIPEVVYRTLEEQAAQRLSHVPVDAAVDRSLLIRVGYVLLGVVAAAALYKVFSPKDPIVTAERVLMPWADIVPASRVAIRDVKPGSLTVSQGESVDVSADVRGIGEDESVLLRYTTDDGQAIDKPLEMTLSGDGLRFEARLPDETGTSHKLGLAQNVRYRIEAGDARSLEYALKVVPAPSILVQRVEYDFPEYTGYLDRATDGLGDVRAIEGTRVTVHAHANAPIDEAHIDFDADGRRDLAMSSDGPNASASFVLELRDDRQTPQHASYVLRFTNYEGRPNRDPVKHPIAVEPDLEPETAILMPQEKTLDVRLDDTVMIEVEARDPDFALSEVRLHGESAGRSVIDRPLLADAHQGRFTSRYPFAPREHDLKAGDVVQYWVEARDNRAPNANTSESERKLLRIVSPDAKQPPPDRIARNDRQQRPQDGQQDEATQQDGQAGQQGNQSGQQQDGQQQQKGDQQQDGQLSRQSEPGANQANRREGDQQPGEQSDPGNGQSASADRDSKANEQPNRAPDNQNDQQRDANNATDQNQQQGGSQTQQGGSGNQNGEQTGAGSAGGDSQKGSQPSGARPDRNNASRPGNGTGENGGENGGEDAQQAPVSSDGDNDAEAFKRIQKHLQRNGELKDDQSGSPESNAADRQPQPNDGEATNGEDAALSREPQPGAQQGDEQGDKEAQSQRDSQQQPGEQSNNPSGESASADGEKKSTNQSDQQENAGQRSSNGGEGTGAEAEPQDLPEDAQKQQSKSSDGQRESPGGQQTASKGPSGAGNQEQSEGAPNSRPEMKPTEKRQQSGSDGEQTDEKEPSAGARGKRESDSQGEEGGDQAGGGEEGGGQKAPREGTGSAGQNQSADEGAGESSEKGAGNTSPNAGSDSTANDRTGQPGGETKGRGTKTRDGVGNEPGGETGSGAGEHGNDNQSFSREPQASADAQHGQGDNETAKQGESEQPAEQMNTRNGESTSADGQKNQAGEPDNGTADPNEKMGSQQGGAPSGGGGQTGTVESPPRSSQGDVPDGDAANLEYAREQTDLVLDKLADKLKKQDVDEQLLEDLGWTEEDMRQFLERWQQRKDAAARNTPAGEAAKHELDDALRSLGLRRGELRQNQFKDDTQRDLREGFRGPVPLKYQDRLRRYNQGVSRSRREGAGE